MVGTASFLCWMFFVMGMGNLIAASLMYWTFGVCGQRLALRLRLMLYRAILHMEMGWFDLEKNSSGVLTTRLATDASQVGAVGRGCVDVWMCGRGEVWMPGAHLRTSYPCQLYISPSTHPSAHPLHSPPPLRCEAPSAT